MKDKALNFLESFFFNPITLRETRGMFRKKTFLISHLVILIVIGGITLAICMNPPSMEGGQPRGLTAQVLELQETCDCEAPAPLPQERPLCTP